MASIASIPPEGNPIARTALLGFEPAVELAVDVGADDAEFTEPAWAEEAWELDADEDSLAELDSFVLTAAEEEAVAVALALTGVVMYSPLASMYE